MCILSKTFQNTFDFKLKFTSFFLSTSPFAGSAVLITSGAIIFFNLQTVSPITISSEPPNSLQSTDSPLSRGDRKRGLGQHRLAAQRASPRNSCMLSSCLPWTWTVRSSFPRQSVQHPPERPRCWISYPLMEVPDPLGEMSAKTGADRPGPEPLTPWQKSPRF